MNAPHTYFSTEFRGSPQALRGRLQNLFAARKRRGLAPLACLLLCAALAGGLVACNTGPSGSDAPFGVPQAVYEYAVGQAGDQGKLESLEVAFLQDGVLDAGTLAVYSAHLGTKDFDPADTPLAGGRYIDDDGYLFEEWSDLFLFRQEGETYTPLGRTTELDTSPQQAVTDYFLAQDDPAGPRLLALDLLDQADAAFAPFTGDHPTEGDPYTDESGTVWRKLTGFEAWSDALRVDDQVFSGLIPIFGRDKAAELMQTYVYVPDSVFLERDGGLWVRADAADHIGWRCASDPSTLSVTGFTGEQLDFTLEGTDAGQPVTWRFTAQRRPDGYGYQFTRYYHITAGLYTPDPADGKPQAVVDAVQAEMDGYAAALEAENGATKILSSELLSLDQIRSLTQLVAGRTLEVWSFRYRLRPADFHTVTLSGGMGVDGDGWLVDLYPMGDPCVIAVRDDTWTYTVLGVGSSDDFGASTIHYRAAQIITEGAARNGLALTEAGWTNYLHDLLPTAAEALSHYPQNGYNYTWFTAEVLEHHAQQEPSPPPGVNDIALTELAADHISFTANSAPYRMEWTNEKWVFTQFASPLPNRP